MSDLVQIRDGGDRLSHPELIATAVLLLNPGLTLEAAVRRPTFVLRGFETLLVAPSG